MGIRNIIFDLGDVLLSIDRNKTLEAFRTKGATNIHSLIEKPATTNLLNRLEIGEIAPTEFCLTFNRLLDLKLNEADIIKCWNKTISEFSIKRLNLLQQLKGKYRLFLLSNTNIIHEKCFRERLKQQTGDDHLSTYFEKVYFSHRIGLRKPNPQSFQWVMDSHNLKPEETLFIDDRVENIEAARALGIIGLQILNGMNLKREMNAVLVK